MDHYKDPPFFDKVREKESKPNPDHAINRCSRLPYVDPLNLKPNPMMTPQNKSCEVMTQDYHKTWIDLD